MVIIDFNEEQVSWDFKDIYAIDRLIQEKDQLPAPDFFHNLSKNTSLRDANFWPILKNLLKNTVILLRPINTKHQIQL